MNNSGKPIAKVYEVVNAEIYLLAGELFYLACDVRQTNSLYFYFNYMIWL